jgi:hypothetical protein
VCARASTTNYFFREGGFLVKPSKEVKQSQQTPQLSGAKPRPRLRIVKLEERIAPKLATNHNETLVREQARARPKGAKPRGKQKSRLQIVKLEQRIAPKLAVNHNEKLVRDRPVKAR